MTKELQKEIMLRAKLKNKFNKERNHINSFNSLNMKQVSDNELFWKSIMPFLMTKDLILQN